MFNGGACYFDAGVMGKISNLLSDWNATRPQARTGGGV